jgi:hypothetical protein
VVEGANSKRGLANRTSSCGRGYGSQSRRCSLRGCPSADTYDNLCSLSDSQPYSHRHAYSYSYAYAYANTTPDTHSCAARTHADADPDPHAHPYARLRRTIPKLGVAILR